MESIEQFSGEHTVDADTMFPPESEDEDVGEATPVKKATKKSKGNTRALVASKRATAVIARSNPKFVSNNPTCFLFCLKSPLLPQQCASDSESPPSRKEVQSSHSRRWPYQRVYPVNNPVSCDSRRNFTQYPYIGYRVQTRGPRISRR